MASAPTAKTSRILARAMRDRLGYDGPDGIITSIRCNGREFHYRASNPSPSQNSDSFVTYPVLPA
jgi:hypothetical protein